MKWKVNEHSGIDKSFGTGNKHIWMEVDYDDVNHMEVDAAMIQMKEIMEKHWDEKMHESLYMKTVVDNWYRNESNIQSDYENRDEYLKDHGIKVDRQGNLKQ